MAVPRMMLEADHSDLVQNTIILTDSHPNSQSRVTQAHNNL